MIAESAVKSAFECLIGPFRPSLLNLALELTKNRADAEDLLQETEVRVWKYFHNYDLNRGFHPWVCKIMQNLYLTNVNGKTITLERHENEPISAPVDVDKSCVVKEAIDSLPPLCKQAVEMYYFLGMDVKSIAQAIDKPSGTVKSTLYRARMFLRESLGEYAFVA